MNVALIGMSGVGKSRIGKLLADRLGYGFVDIDRIIEKGYGKKLQEVIDSLGDEKFIKLEEQTTRKIGKVNNSIISLGGSSVYSDKAMAFVKSIAKVVFLNAPLGEIKRRTEDFSERGIVGLKEKGLEKLFMERLPLYRKYADITIDLQGLDDEAIVNLIIQKVL